MSRYWWVNHKQTFKEEVEGGYIWSPKTNSDGRRNQTYINLTRTQPGDTIFSYAHAEIKAIGTIAASHREGQRPNEFGTTGEQWDLMGWQVEVDWKLLPHPFHPKDFIEDIRDLLPSKYSPIRRNGNGNQGCYLAEISEELTEVLLTIASIENPNTVKRLRQEAESTASALPSPSLSNISSREHVLQAIAEYDAIGREAFLEQYGYGEARSYFLVHEGSFYDSKAIVGVAHQFTAPNQRYLQAEEFSGGAATVQALLEKLGFTVVSSKPSHATYLLTWNPTRWEWQTLDQNVQDIATNGSLIMRSSCGNTQSIEPGSRVFLLCQGPGPRGIIGAGTVVTGSYQAEHYDSERAAKGDMAWHVDVAYDSLVNPFKSPYLPREVLDEPQFEGMHWDPAASGFRIPDAIAVQLETTWAEYAEAPFTYGLPKTALQIKEPPVTYSEGQAKQVNTTRYERNPKARQRCRPLPDTAARHAASN